MSGTSQGRSRGVSPQGFLLNVRRARWACRDPTGFRLRCTTPWAPPRRCCTGNSTRYRAGELPPPLRPAPGDTLTQQGMSSASVGLGERPVSRGHSVSMGVGVVQAQGGKSTANCLQTPQPEGARVQKPTHRPRHLTDTWTDTRVGHLTDAWIDTWAQTPDRHIDPNT